MSVGDSSGIRSFGGGGGGDDGTVTTDGVTIIGTGSADDPLIAVDQSSGGGGTPAAVGTYLVRGAVVAWVSDYTYRVGAADYYIDGTLYASAEQNVTAGAADPTFDRIDVLALDTNGDLVVIAGTAASAPAQPAVDPTLYLQVSFIYVAANTTDAPVTENVIYEEDAEWDTTASAGTINVASTNNPRTGTKCIEGTAVTNGQYFASVSPGTIDLSLQNSLVFYIDCKVAWANKKAMRLTWLNNTSIRGQQLTIGHGQYGFNSALTGSYQQIVVPVTDFLIPAGILVDRLKVEFIGTGTAVGFYMDDIVLQAGFSQGAISRGNVVFRGEWDATTSYATNDLVLRNGVAYIAQNTNTNAAPETSSAYWGLLSAPTPKGIYVESPSASEKIPMFFLKQPWTLSEIRSVLYNGSATPSVTFSIRYGTDVSAAGTEVVTSGITVTNTTTGLSTTSFNSGTIPAGNFVWLTTSAQSGTVPSLSVTLA